MTMIPFQRGHQSVDGIYAVVQWLLAHLWDRTAKEEGNSKPGYGRKIGDFEIWALALESGAHREVMRPCLFPAS